MKKIVLGITTILLLMAAAAGLMACAAMGNSPTSDKAAMYTTSTNHDGAAFVNARPIDMELKTEESTISLLMRFFSFERNPKNPLPIKQLTYSDFPHSPKGLQVTWLGHSSTIVEIDGVRILTDPVFGNASPVPFTVNRFQPAPISLSELPRLDAVVISHDHYDHLEMKTIKALKDKVPLFIVPLGVGSHLKKWGIAKNQIIELDWWQTHVVDSVHITATPSRHFSGRGLRDRFKTLWASFVFKGPEHSVFFSADGGYDARFREIGERLGPFDLTMIEIGAWNTAWPEVHLFPRQAVKAHTELGGKHMLPIHWAAYDLSMHQWDDPIKMTTQLALENDVSLLTPMMGQKTIPGKTTFTPWWEIPENS